MKIIVTKNSDNDYTADCIDLPGTVPIGRGSNKWESVGSLIYGLASENIIWARRLKHTLEDGIKIEEKDLS